MTDYEVEYSFQNIRFTDPADFGGKDTLFTIGDLDLSEDEKYVLIDFMADHRLPGRIDDYPYDYEYWGDNAIFCTVMAYDEDELKSMTEGRLVTSIGPTFQDLFILWNEFPDWLKSKVKDYWGKSVDMLLEWACSVEDVSDDDNDDDDFEYALEEDYADIADIGDKTASNGEDFSYSLDIDSDSDKWGNNINLDGSYNLELQILNDCLDHFKDRGGLREAKITDEAEEELEYIAKDIINNYRAGHSVKFEIVYQGTFYPDDDRAVIDNVHIWQFE
ncbi:MAG: hypothetical protein J6S67_00660 [Methanobrevibacter sp.]|nr:hypothetical protein [Methanobrevibacter sp.]